MEVFKTQKFSQWAISEGITDTALIKAVSEMKAGLIDANLGGGLYKKRVARSGQGKSGGYRSLLAFKTDHRAVFLFGFAKNEQSDLTPKQEILLKTLAKYYLTLSSAQLKKLLEQYELWEVT